MNDLLKLNELIRERERAGLPVKRLENKFYKTLGYELQRRNRQRI